MSRWIENWYSVHVYSRFCLWLLPQTAPWLKLIPVRWALNTDTRTVMDKNVIMFFELVSDEEQAVIVFSLPNSLSHQSIKQSSTLINGTVFDCISLSGTWNLRHESSKDWQFVKPFRSITWSLGTLPSLMNSYKPRSRGRVDWLESHCYKHVKWMRSHEAFRRWILQHSTIEDLIERNDERVHLQLSLRLATIWRLNMSQQQRTGSKAVCIRCLKTGKYQHLHLRSRKQQINTKITDGGGSRFSFWLIGESMEKV